jgi:hypothetical protein
MVVKRFGMVLSVIVVLSFVSTAFGEDLGDGFYLHNVDQYSDVVSVSISPAEMSRILDLEPNELAGICKTFYTKFNDEFDFIFMVCFSNLVVTDIHNITGYHNIVFNDATGIGLRMGVQNDIWDLPSKLKGFSLLDRTDIVYSGMLLHEMSHQWLTHIFEDEINAGNHWGLSNAGGVMGGFKEVINLDILASGNICQIY